MLTFIYTWIYENGVKEKSPRPLWPCTFGALVGLKEGRETRKKKIKQRERVNKSKEKREKKMTFPLVFISSTLEIVSGEKKTFTANFAQSAENNADPFFIKSDIYIYSFLSVVVPQTVLIVRYSETKN